MAILHDYEMCDSLGSVGASSFLAVSLRLSSAAFPETSDIKNTLTRGLVILFLK
jgi:hypothetical protein